jgi:hypothetical protein
VKANRVPAVHLALAADKLGPIKEAAPALFLKLVIDAPGILSTENENLHQADPAARVPAKKFQAAEAAPCGTDSSTRADTSCVAESRICCFASLESSS